MAIRVLVGVVALSAACLADPREDFETKVRPVLAKNCFACHRDTAMGGLRLDSRAAILKGGATGPAAVEGKADESLLIKVIEHTHDRLKMPPSGKMKAEDIAAIRSWIDSGAYWPEEKPTQSPRRNRRTTSSLRSTGRFGPSNRLSDLQFHRRRRIPSTHSCWRDSRPKVSSLPRAPMIER